jgi:vacuolar-type H+-ATPase subunit I/STV1
VQDKFDDCEKSKELLKKQRKQQDEDIMKELQRYKDLLGLREKEIDSLKAELRRIQKSNEDLRKHCELVDKESRKGGSSSQMNIHKQSMNQGIDILGYNQHFESQSTDLRKTNYNFPNAAQSTTNTNNNGLITTTSGISGISSSMFKTQYDSGSTKFVTQTDRNQELSRLKKEYNQMVKKEISKIKKEGGRDGIYTESSSKSPDRTGNGHSNSNSFI